MSRFKEILSRLPGWLFTVLTVMLILWLTLAPDPLGDDAPTLFPGADKLVHAVMFGFLTVMILLDMQRKDRWKPESGRRMILAAAASAALGILVEFLQRTMDMGRGFETTDMAADIAGAAVCACCWGWLQRRWTA